PHASLRRFLPLCGPVIGFACCPDPASQQEHQESVRHEAGRAHAGGMAWTTTDDVEEFLAVAGDLLRSRPAENTLPLTVAQTLRDRGGRAFGQATPRFGWWRSAEGRVA